VNQIIKISQYKIKKGTQEIFNKLFEYVVFMQLLLYKKVDVKRKSHKYKTIKQIKKSKIKKKGSAVKNPTSFILSKKLFEREREAFYYRLFILQKQKV
jgi:hypothetical protein